MAVMIPFLFFAAALLSFGVIAISTMRAWPRIAALLQGELSMRPRSIPARVHLLPMARVNR